MFDTLTTEDRLTLVALGVTKERIAETRARVQAELRVAALEEAAVRQREAEILARYDLDGRRGDRVDVASGRITRAAKPGASAAPEPEPLPAAAE